LREYEIATHNLGESALLRRPQRRVWECWAFPGKRREWKSFVNESIARVISKIKKEKCLRILLKLFCQILRKTMLVDTGLTTDDLQV